MFLETTVGPTEEPVNLIEAKESLRETAADEDMLIMGMIAAARSHVESYLRRRLITQTVIAHGDGFCDLNALPVSPVSAVGGVTYRALDDTMMTVDPAIYRAYLNREPPAILPKWGFVWPIAQPGPDSVQVTLTVGYGRPADVPPAIRTAILLIVGHLYANREAVSDTALAELPLGVRALLQPHVFWV